MDALGHVNNVVFAGYFESARVDFFENLKINTGFTLPDKVGPLLLHLEMDYKRQVTYPADLEVTVGAVSITSRIFKMGCSIWDRADECVAAGSSHHIWFDFNSGRPMRIMEDFRTILEPMIE